MWGRLLMIGTLSASRWLSGILGIGIALLLPLACAAQIPDARGQTAAQSKTNALVDKINGNTLMVLTAGSGLTYGAFAADLATVLNDGDEFRILPVQGHSAFQNVRDVRFLRGIDMGFVQSNVLGYYRRNGLIPDISDKISYLFKVCNLEIHIITRSDITSVEQLRGKKVNVNQAGSGTQLTAMDLFSFLGIKVEEVNMRQNDAFEAQERRDCCNRGVDRQAFARNRQVEIERGLPHPADPIRQEDAWRFCADDADTRGLSRPDSGRSDRRDCGERNNYDRLQLAKEHRSLSAPRQIRQNLLPAPGGIPQTAATREVERHGPLDSIAGLEAIRGRRRMAQAVA
jgi:hypothetical protein